MANITFTTIDNITHQVYSGAEDTVWVPCVGVGVKRWPRGVPQSQGLVDCMTCLVYQNKFTR